MLEAHVSEAMGHHVPAAFEYSEKARQGSGSLSVHFVSMKQGVDTRREYEQVAGGGEQFRSPPLCFTARYMISAWARPPEDQALLGAVMRTFLDYPKLEFGDDEEEVVAYAGVPSISARWLGLEEHQLLASAFQMPLAPSVSYELDLRLRSQRVSPIKRVRERVVDFRNIEG